MNDIMLLGDLLVKDNKITETQFKQYTLNCVYFKVRGIS